METSVTIKQLVSEACCYATHPAVALG